MWKCIAPGQRTRAGCPGPEPGARGERRCCQSDLHHRPQHPPLPHPFVDGRLTLLEEIALSKPPRNWQLKERNKSQLGRKEERKKIHPPRRLARDIYSSVRDPLVHPIAVVPFFFFPLSLSQFFTLCPILHTTLTNPSMRRQKKVASLHPSIPSHPNSSFAHTPHAC